MALPTIIEAENPESAQRKHLLLGTVSFTVCFAAWGLISAFAPHFRQQFHLSATQTAFLVAVPVLLGALARIPIGMLADRFGGRTVFTVLMFLVAVPVALVPAATSYRNLLVVAFLLGMAGSSFAVGVGYVSRWFSMESQGSALGVYGLGNIGQSAAVFLGPVVAAAYGFRIVYWGMSVILAGLGRCVRPLCSKRSTCGQAQGSFRDARRARTRTLGVGAGRFLFSDLWWIRRLLNVG
jgi:nitrate/nitrite transporter NarK